MFVGKSEARIRIIKKYPKFICKFDKDFYIKKPKKEKFSIYEKNFNLKWHNLTTRCTYKKGTSYKYYVNKGIKCLWKDRNEFKKDMYESYLKHINEYGFKETTLDRINSNGNYCKENCRWATWKEQAETKKPLLTK